MQPLTQFGFDSSEKHLKNILSEILSREGQFFTSFISWEISHMYSLN